MSTVDDAAISGAQAGLAGRVAVVTGGGGGIGRAEALCLARHGMRVVVNDLPGSGAAQSVVDEIVAEGGMATAVPASIAEWETAGLLVDAAKSTYGRLDLVVNNAGIVRHQLFADITPEDYEQIVAVNLRGTFALCHAAVPVMREQGRGRIVNTASNQWAAPIGNAHYAATKGAVVSLTYDLAWELQNDGITVNAIAPFALTAMTSRAIDRDEALQAQGLMSERRRRTKETRSDPRLVAPLVAYLASDQAADVTGLVFRVGGGKVGVYSHPQEVRTLFHVPGATDWPISELADRLPPTVLAGGTRAPHLD